MNEDEETAFTDDLFEQLDKTDEMDDEDVMDKLYKQQKLRNIEYGFDEDL